MSRAAKSTRATPAARGRSPSAAAPRDLGGASLLLPVTTIAQQLRSWADGVIGVAGPLSDLSMSMAGAFALSSTA